MSHVSIEYFGVSGIGRNVTEAKRDAGRKIEAMVDARKPRIVSWRGHAQMIWRGPEAWCSASVCDAGELREDVSYQTHGIDDLEDVIRSCKRHMAQMAWKPEDGTACDLLADDRNEARDFARWAEFQLRYREARACGMTDQDAFDFAQRNPARPQLWQTVA